MFYRSYKYVRCIMSEHDFITEEHGDNLPTVRIKKVILKRTITLVERVAFKSSKDPSRWGFYETPIPEKLKNRTKHNS